jgi:dihydroxyacetone kinase
MTLAAALEKADRQFDPIAEQNLLDTAMMVYDMGGTDTEIAAFVERQRKALARTRAEMHDMVRASYWTSLDSPSVRVH